MKRALLAALVAIAAGAALTGFASADNAPPGATARCNDGTYSYSQHRSGTCSHHGGVAAWLTGSTSGSGSGSSSGSRSAGGACGVERWTVKTLQDRPSLLPVKRTTVAYLISRPRPANLATARLPFERHVFQVIAAVVLVRAEADSDLHLVLQAGGNHMIAEAPSPLCDIRATPARHTQMAVARAAVRLCAMALVTGVAFFDFDHGQTGVAPNAIELHPVLGFRCLSPS